MTESYYRNALGSKTHSALIESKAEAGKLIERTIFTSETLRDKTDERKYYAQLFDEVSKIMGAFAQEVAGNMR